MKSFWISPAEALEARTRSLGNKVAFGYLRLGSRVFDEFQTMTWKEAEARCQKYRRYLHLLGLKPGDRIAIWGMNRVEWVLLDWASLISGVVTVPLYKASREDELNFILDEASCKFVFCDETNAQLRCDQITFAALEDEVERMGEGRIPVPTVDSHQLATLIYTSGTQGRPKGVMHSYQNLSGGAIVCNSVAKLSPKDRLFSYLPLSHVAERTLIDLGSLYTGASVYFLDRIEKLIHYLPKARPTIFLAVPRVWDTLRFRLEKELGNSVFRNWGWLLRFAVKRKLGLDRARYCVSGAAKLSFETHQALEKFGIQIMEAYGLTETLGVTTLATPGNIVTGSCGKFYPHIDYKIADDGEILVRSFFQFKGYFNQPELTEDVLKDGWFSTGDIGHLDEEGNLFITDRKKNLFKTSGGKYVAPLVAETFLKNHPAIREAMVIGEGRAHCVALVSVDLTIANVSDLEKHLSRVNQKLPLHEQVKVLRVIARPWTAESGELTASFKLKRKVLLDKYAAEIEGLYSARARVVIDNEEGQKQSANSSF